MTLQEELKTHFGHPAFRPGQERVIEALMAGRSALAVFPTGGGKSICYQLPGVLLDGLTLVVSPLIALMKDQVDTLRARGIAAARLDSTLQAGEVALIYQQMEGTLRMLYVAPERLVSEAFMKHLQRARIALLAIDESHCISEWGHNFRPEYLRLAKVAKKLRVPRVLALTATATPEVMVDIARSFRIAVADRVQTPFYRPNLSLHITPVAAVDRLGLLAGKLSGERRFPAIVYVTLQETSETVAGALVRAGLQARAYHAGLADEVRAKTQEDFMAGNLEVIVATIAFGMGIDKADIRAVYHFNLPKTLENYQQEIGRAGRDGQPAHCEMLACRDDQIVLQNFSLGDTPTEAGLRQLLDHLLRQGREFDISRYELSRSTDVRPLVLETVLTYLEKEKVLEPVGAFYTKFQIGFQQKEDSIIAGHAPARQKFLRALFASGKRGWRWLTLDVDSAAESMGENREKILAALTFLEESGDIELKPTGLRHQFRLLKGAEARNIGELGTWLHGLFVEREKKDLARLARVIALAEYPGCTTRSLLKYFGENLPEDCGHCGHCAQGFQRRKRLPGLAPAEITTEHLQAVRKLVDERHPALRSARQLARFLCGLSSPATLRERLTRHDAFGLLAGISFPTVLGQMESLQN